MTEFSRELIFGKRPIRRTDRKPGESEWYYLDPRGASTFSDMKKIDVPTENTPNPYANEIQNYLYKNDEYNYRELYGDTPPPVPQPSTQPATQENKGFGFQSNNGQTTFANTTNDAFGQQNNTFGTNTSFGSQQNTIQNQTPTPWNAVNNSQPSQTHEPIDNINYNTHMSVLTNNRQSKPQNNMINKIYSTTADAMIAALMGAADGRMLGNFDEFMWGLTALTTLNKNNYEMGRDAVRLYQKELYNNHPFIYGIPEFAGAMYTLMQLPPNILAKLKVSNPKLFNFISDTLVASSGYAENWKDFWENMGTNSIVNGAGLYLEQLPFFRGIGKVGNKAAKQSLSYLADKAKNLFYDKDNNNDTQDK